MVQDSFARKIFRYITDAGYRFTVNQSRFGIYNDMSDEEYLKRFFKYKMGYELDLEHPQTFNEKIQWLKIYNRNPAYTTMVDKFEAKKYVAGIIGEKYIIPTLGVWNHFDEINFEVLPSRFVLKCTHDYNSVVICRDKEKLDLRQVKQKLTNCLARNFYYYGREWVYKNVKPRIIAEQYMEDDNSNELTDYKFLCFDGHVKCSFVCTERFKRDGLKVTLFDRDWKRLPFELHYPASKKDIPKPVNYDKMIELAETLSKNIPFVRVDFYETNQRVYFGELTFYPFNGMIDFIPFEWDYELGSWINLPKVKMLS